MHRPKNANRAKRRHYKLTVKDGETMPKVWTRYAKACGYRRAAESPEQSAAIAKRRAKAARRARRQQRRG